MICVSIAQFEQINRVISTGIELIELRLDLIKETPAKIYSAIPDHMLTIATCRPGEYIDSERGEMLKACIDLGASFIDVEIETSEEELAGLISVAHKCDTSVIVSYHNFEQTPGRAELEALLNRCFEMGGDIAKIATHVSSVEDIRNLLNLYDLPGKKVVLGMGNQGRITRLVGPYLGAEFTFASIDTGGETAPGQLNVNQLNEIFKVIDKS